MHQSAAPVAWPDKEDGVGEPTWEVALLYPNQGTWSEAEYLALDGNHLVEFSHGFLEVLAMPTTSHQWIGQFLHRLLDAFVVAGARGLALMAPLRIRLWEGKFREPDVVCMLTEHLSRVKEEYWEGADLVMEVVSADEKDRRRDLEIKPVEYARAKIPECWLVDPMLRRITVLRLEDGKYVEHGVFVEGQRATSQLLQGFGVEVSTVFSGPKFPSCK